MAENLAPEVKVVLTAEDQGVSAAIRQLGQELGTLKTKQDAAAKSAQQLGTSFKTIAQESLNAVKLRIANIPGLGNFGSSLALRAYEPIGKELEQGAEALETKFGAAAGTIGIAAGAIVALGAVAVGVTHHMMELAQSIENTAAATGLSTRQVQEYNEIAKELGLDAGTLETAFSRIQVQLGEYITKGKAAGAGSQFLVQVFDQLGVSLKDTQGNLRPVNDILGDFYDALGKISNESTRTALTLEAFGTRGRIIAQMFAEARREGVSYRELLASIDSSGNVIPDSQLDNLMKAKGDWDELMRSIRGARTEFEGFIAEMLLHPVQMFDKAALGRDDAAAAKAKANAGISAEDLQAVGDATALNDKLEKRVAILRAGGEEQLELTAAEAAYSSAARSNAIAMAANNLELAKEKRIEMDLYAKQIPLLKEAMALEDAKKHHGGESAPPDAANKASLALALKQQQDLLEIAKAGAAEREEVEKGEYERGLISIAQYYGDRKQAVQDGTTQEIAALQKEREQLVASADLAGNRAVEARTGAAKTPAEKQRLAAEADKFSAEQLEALTRIDELDAKITAAQISSRTQLERLDQEQNKAELEGKAKILEFLQQIDALEGKTSEKAQAQADSRAAEIRALLQQFEGQNVGGTVLDPAAIDALIAKYKDLKLAAAEFQDTQKDISLLMKQMQLDIDAVKVDRTKTQAEKEREYLNILKQEGPLLEKKAQEELAAARATGDQGLIQQAEDALQQIRLLESETQELGNKWRETFAQTMGGALKQFANTATTSTRGVAAAFGDMELTVIHALENTAAQMIANALTGQAIDAETRLSSAKTAAANTYKWVSDIPFVGWIIAPAAAAAAFATVLAFKEGGAVSGPGGVDRVPAMLTAGEFVVNAEAAKSFGVENLHAINAGEMPAFSDRPSFATPTDFSSSRFETPEAFEPASRVVHNNFDVTLQHNGKDALEVLQDRLVPELKRSYRAGELDFIAP